MTTISTRLGKVKGLATGDSQQFLGIPFAAAPVGARRFRAPEPHVGWKGTRDATQFGNRALQPEAPGILGGAKGEQDEDCLVLNVHTPAADQLRRPVLFWIHGGSYTMGSANEYDGSVLAEQGDVVVVTVNYRLGLFGFLDLSKHGAEYAGSASNGFRDQILALRWVHDNIADYGGDPNNVTIFGESAGGGSVNALLACPSADGLYHRAIAHSGSAMSTPPPNLTPALAAHLKVDESNLITMLRDLSGPALLDAQITGGVSGGASVDGHVVTRSTYDAIAARATRGVPYIAGSNLNEGTLFTALAPNADSFEPMSAMLATMTFDGADPTSYLAALKTTFPKEDTKARYERVWTDMFRRAAIRICEANTAAGPGGWLYRFDLQSTIDVMGHKLGATHACEIPFTFNTYARKDAPGIVFHDRADPAVRKLAERWSNTVVAFARTGDPNGAGLPQWPRYSATDRHCLVLDTEARVENDPDAVQRKLWGDV